MGSAQMGVMLHGDPYDLDDWMEVFAYPFDPYIEKQDNFYILRSIAFDQYESARELDAEASGLVDRLNGLMAITHGANPARAMSVVEIGPTGITKQYVFARMSATAGRDKARAVVVTLGPDGVPLPPPPPRPSNGQRWIALAEGDDNLGDLLVYHSRGADWFDMYKAVECMERVYGSEKELADATRLPINRIKLLKRTANLTRHARGKFDEPVKPMDRAEAHEMVGRMIRRIFTVLEEERERLSHEA